MKLYVTTTDDADTVYVRASIESEHGERTVGDVSRRVNRGESAFGLDFARLLSIAETTGVLDLTNSGEQG